VGDGAEVVTHQAPARLNAAVTLLGFAVFMPMASIDRNRPAKACCVLSWRQASLHQSKQAIEMR